MFDWYERAASRARYKNATRAAAKAATTAAPSAAAAAAAAVAFAAFAFACAASACLYRRQQMANDSAGSNTAYSTGSNTV